MDTAERDRLDAKGLFARGFRLIVSYVRMHPRPFGVAVAGAFVFAVASVAVTVALGRVTDRVLRPAFGPEGVPASTVWLGIGAVMGLASLRALGIGIRRFYSGVAGSAVAATLRDRVSDRYRDLALSYHRAQPTGELLAHMEADVEASIDVLYPIPFSIGVVFLVVFALGSLIATDPYLALVGLLVVPALACMNRSFARRMQGPARRAQERIGEVSAVAHESIDGALVVKTLGRERAETRTPRTRRPRRSASERVDAGFVRAGFEPALEALPSLAMTVLLGVGAWRVSTGDVTLGVLVQVVTLFGLLAWPMRFIGWILSELPRAVVGHDRIVEVLEQPVTIERPARPVALPDGPLDVRAEALTYGFGGTRRPRRGHVPRPARTSRSRSSVRRASGKSTLAQLLVRLDDPDAGEVLLGGVNLRHADPASLRRAASRRVPGELPVREHRRREHRARLRRHARARSSAPPTIAQADRFIARAPEGVRHRPRRARSHALGRRAPAGRARPRAGARAARADPGRRDERRGPDDRGRDPRRACAASCDTTLIVDRVPPLDDPAGRPRALPGGRPAPRDRLARGADGHRARLRGDGPRVRARRAMSTATATEEETPLAAESEEDLPVPAHLRGAWSVLKEGLRVSPGPSEGPRLHGGRLARRRRSPTS